ncbi:MAG: type II toxin-antitoxin system VapC family toxin [Candidatus Micrarchaeota archaeon]
MKIVDASVLVAFLNESDELHAKATALDLEDSVTSQLAFAETANVLKKRVNNKPAVMSALRQVFDNTPVIALSDYEMNEALELFGENYPRLSFIDCSLLAQSRARGAALVTFDEQLAKASARKR